jgi:O-antigen ligase
MAVTTRARPEAVPARPLIDRRDAVGLLLLAAAVAWTFLSAFLSGGNPWPMAASFLVAGAAYAGGRAGGGRSRVLVPAIVAASAVVLAGLTWIGAFGAGADVWPLGYENARAAFFVVASVASLMLAAATHSTTLRVLAFGAAVLFAGLPLATRAGAASFVVVLLPAAAAFTLQRRPVRIPVLGSALIVLAAIGGTILVGVGGPRSAAVALVGDTLDERRVVLWSDAIHLMANHPVAGVGPGRFQTESPTARSDYDARWAHNGFLQQGAETGVIGFSLLVLLFLWGFGRLLPGDPYGLTVLGAFALATLGFLATLDYVLHFPAVIAPVAALVGAASAGEPAPAIPKPRREV